MWRLKHSVTITIRNSRFGSWMYFSSFLGAQPRGSVSRDRVKKILQTASPLSSHAAVSAVSLTVLVPGNWTVQCATQHVRTVSCKNKVGLMAGHSNGFFCSNVWATPLFTLHIRGCGSLVPRLLRSGTRTLKLQAYTYSRSGGAPGNEARGVPVDFIPGLVRERLGTRLANRPS